MFAFDDSDPRYMICYTGVEDSTPADFHLLFAHWAQRLQTSLERFAVLLVYQQPHHEEHDEHDPEHQKEEQEMMRAFMDFGRNHKARVAQMNPACAQVIPPAWAEEDPDGWEKAREIYRRMIPYQWGIPGESFLSLDEAKAWLESQFVASAAPSS